MKTRRIRPSSRNSVLSFMRWEEGEKLIIPEGTFLDSVARTLERMPVKSYCGVARFDYKVGWKTLEVYVRRLREIIDIGDCSTNKYGFYTSRDRSNTITMFVFRRENS